MKLGFLTGTIADIEKAGRLGFDGIELAANAFGDPLAGPLDSDALRKAKQLCEQHRVEIMALAYYDLMLRSLPWFERSFRIWQRLSLRSTA